MIEDQVVTHASIRYLWSFRPHMATQARCWHWSFAGHVESAPTRLVPELNVLFIARVAPDMVAELHVNDYDWFLYVLRDMGATEDQVATVFRLGSDSSRMPVHKVRARQWTPPDLPPWNNLAVRDWLSSSQRFGRPLPWAVTIIGAEPLEKSVIGESLKPIELLETNESTEVVVLGRRDLTQDDIEAIIERRVGEDLRIYSQEMFVTLCLCGSDTFDACPAVLEAFRRGHPGLEFVSRRWLGWETGYVDEDWRHHSHRRLEKVEWPEQSPLHVRGYRVGKTGQPTDDRHRILKQTYTGRLQIVGPVEYMAEWGAEGSSRRLSKIAESIAAHCRNMKRRSHTSIDAIRDWEADLDWLQVQFYHVQRPISWPGTGT